MADLGYTKITNDVIIGETPRRVDLNVETAANMYPGRLAAKGTTDFDLQVATALLPPAGWLGYGHANSAAKPATRDTIYVADKVAPLHRGGDFQVRSKLAAGASVSRYQLLANWAAGHVIGPVTQGDGGIWLSVPFVKKISVEDTTIDLPSTMVVKDVLVEVTTAVASGEIDIGILAGEAGGDEDGFVDSATTRGPLLRTFLAGSNAVEDVGTYEEKEHLCDGTAKSLTYTTTDHAIAGNFHILLVHPNFQIVAQADESIDASAAAAALWALNRI
jgi:hypothetical protein